MALGLVARSARALSEHLNLYYRVLKGIDPDTVALRLSSGGFFDVRHSVTATPILRVTDAGIQTPIDGAVLSDGTVTSAKIADGTIVGADIADNTIPSSKLLSGIAVPANSITTAEIADGTILAADIAAGAISQGAGGGGIPTTDANQATPGIWYDLPGAQMGMFGLTAGTLMLYGFSILARHTAAGGRNAFRVVRLGPGTQLGQASPSIGHATANNDVAHIGLGYFSCPASGSLTFGLQAYMVDAGTATTFAGTGYMHFVELRR